MKKGTIELILALIIIVLGIQIINLYYNPQVRPLIDEAAQGIKEGLTEETQ